MAEIEVFGQEKGVIIVIYQISDKIESKKGHPVPGTPLNWLYVTLGAYMYVTNDGARRVLGANSARSWRNSWSTNFSVSSADIIHICRV